MKIAPWLSRNIAFVLPAAIVLAWHLSAAVAHSVLFPGPIDVATAVVSNFLDIASELRWTIYRAALGFSAAVALSVPVGIFLGRVRILGRLVEPLMEILATIPSLALIPIVMLFAGTGDSAKVVIICYAASMPLLINTYEASRSIDPMYTQVARSLRMSQAEIMWLVDLPSSLPMIVTGLRLAVAYSLLVSITSEMILSTNGIGVFLQKQQENFQFAAGLAGLIFISLTGVAINYLVNRIDKSLLAWHYRGGG